MRFLCRGNELSLIHMQVTHYNISCELVISRRFLLPPGKWWRIILIRQWTLPSKSVAIHHISIIIPFDATHVIAVSRLACFFSGSWQCFYRTFDLNKDVAVAYVFCQSVLLEARLSGHPLIDTPSCLQCRYVAHRMKIRSKLKISTQAVVAGLNTVSGIHLCSTV